MTRAPRRRIAIGWATALGAVLLVGATADAAPRRYALIVANNNGSSSRPALRFAEEDAQRLAHVLTELGGFSAQDVRILNGRSVDQVRAGMSQMRQSIAAARSRPGDQALLIFYYSGHSDGEALELGADRLPFSELRRWVHDTPADIRIAVVDSCRSGGLLATKGGTLSPRFDLHFENELASAGEVLITSSAADEVALESAELRASYFSHHLVSGLRGAADASGDGEVTLAEAYHYAFARTVSTTANTVVGPQHPVYDYKLAGKGDVVLTRLQRPSAVVELPSRFDRVLVMNDDTVVLEVAAGAAHRVGLAPGAYRLRAWRGSELRTGRLSVRAGEVVTVTDAQLSLAPHEHAPRRKGGSDDGSDDGSMVTVSGGMATSVGPGAAALTSLRLDFSFGAAPALTYSLLAGTVQVPGGRESRFEAGAAWRWAAGTGALTAHAGVYAGVAAELQRVDEGGSNLPGTYWSTMALAGPTAALQWWAVRGDSLPNLAVVLRVDAPVALYARQHSAALGFLPSAWIGVAF